MNSKSSIPTIEEIKKEAVVRKAELDCYRETFIKLFRQRASQPVLYVSFASISWYYVNGIEVSEAVDRYIIAIEERQANGDIKSSS